MTVFEVHHTTTHRYGAAMTDGYTVAHLLARDTPAQRVLDVDLRIEPAPDEREDHVDVFGNRVVRLGIHHRHDAITITSTSRVEVDTPSIPEVAELSWDEVAAAATRLRGAEVCEVGPFLATTPTTPSLDALDQLIAPVFTPGRDILDTIGALTSLIYTTFEFDPGFSDVTTPLGMVIDHRRGVCQDFAHLMAAALRSRGLAVRYVSGYLETDPPPGQPKMMGSDASHAWCGVWVPGYGWIDADPTNDQVPPRRHVTVGWGRDYFDVTPVRGVVIGPVADQELDVAVDVIAHTRTSSPDTERFTESRMSKDRRV